MVEIRRNVVKIPLERAQYHSYGYRFILNASDVSPKYGGDISLYLSAFGGKPPYCGMHVLLWSHNYIHNCWCDPQSEQSHLQKLVRNNVFCQNLQHIPRREMSTDIEF